MSIEFDIYLIIHVGIILKDIFRILGKFGFSYHFIHQKAENIEIDFIILYRYLNIYLLKYINISYVKLVDKIKG